MSFDAISADALADFNPRLFTLEGMRKVAHVSGEGSAAILMTGMPEISPQAARSTRWIRGAGFTIYMPSLFFRNSAVPEAINGANNFWRACVSAEFVHIISSPVTSWLRALVRVAHEQCGVSGVGSIKKCIAGNIALTKMAEPVVHAPVLMLPSLPSNEHLSLEIIADGLVSVRERLDRGDLTVLAYRFEGDQICSAERFVAHANTLGNRFVARTLPDSAAGDDLLPLFAKSEPHPHSVVTVNLIDKACEPTLQARDEIITFFSQGLAVSAL